MQVELQKQLGSDLEQKNSCVMTIDFPPDLHYDPSGVKVGGAPSAQPPHLVCKHARSLSHFVSQHMEAALLPAAEAGVVDCNIPANNICHLLQTKRKMLQLILREMIR